MPYDHISLEQKWQKFWDEHHIYQTQNPPFDTPRPKKYILDMFPYPSGAGLHVGHPKGYTATDIMSRFYHANGYNVLHPMGFDAFGLPAENYAIKTGTHPRLTTEANIATFTAQLKSLWFSYDWDRMVDTTDPEYYKWTQWIFLELFKRGLAYEQDLPINYCPSCKTGLANEEVLADNTCDRCGTRVERRPIRQWVLKITEYADRLIEDLDELDWPEGIKEMQRNWIGKSEGCEFRMMKKVERKPIALILHGWEDEWNSSVTRHWQNWMKGKLQEMGYDVHMPELPGFDNPDIETQLTFLEQYKENITEDSIIIWYSMGGLLAMNFVEKLWKKIDQLICIAPAFSWIKEYAINMPSWDFAKKDTQKAWWDSLDYNYDITKVRKNTLTMKVLLSSRDPWIPLEQAKRHFSLEGIDVQIINNAWHFLERDWYIIFPELLNLFDHVDVYTTRIDTVYGMTYAVLAPDHPQVQDFITDEYRTICDQYITEMKGKSDQDRTNEGKEKTGVFTGSYVINPYNGESVPLWIADYVLGSYGTGAVMAVPAHDERDFAFAKKYDLSIRKVILSRSEYIDYNELGSIDFDVTSKSPYTLDGYFPYGIMEDFGVPPELIDASSSEEGAIVRSAFIHYAESEWFGKKKINYKLRDWLFSRQRYWGEPIPLIHITNEDFGSLPRISDTSEATDVDRAYILDKSTTDKRCKNCTCGDVGCVKLIIWGKSFSRVYDGLTGKLIIDSRLPLTLPEVEKYEPSGDGQSPLATVPDWVNVRLADNLTGKRETNTMPQWGGSCWYYLRYMDNKNPYELASREAMEYWDMVDEYVGGAEHAVLHLLYARFWHKVLYDIGVVPTKEPFKKLTNVGLILGPDGQKMSKSRGNVINPNDIVSMYGADTLRLYEMSMGAFTDPAPWNTDAIVGVRRFLDRVYATFTEGKNLAKDEMKSMKLLHKTIKKVTEDIREYKFNTAISALMILLNEGLPTDPEFQKDWKEIFAILLHPFAPHMAEELWSILGNNGSIYDQKWPEYDEFMLIDDEVTIAVQVNGKLRGTLTCLNGVAQDEVSSLAHAHPDIAKWLEGKTLVKEIFIPNKMLSIVIKD
jgi:leucyl-tRNA synthetase